VLYLANKLNKRIKRNYHFLMEK